MTANVCHSILRGQFHIRPKGHDKCPSHRENSFVYLCQDCNTLICSTCTLISHKTHIDSFVEITKIAKTQKPELQKNVNDIDGIKIPKFREEIKLARQELSSCQPKHKQISDDIKKQRDKCRQEINTIAEVQLAICDKMEKVTTDLLQTRITNLEDRLDILMKLSSESKQTLQTGTAVLVYDSVSEIKDMDLDIPHTPNIDMTEFTPGTDRRSHLEQAMGEMKTPDVHLKVCSAPSGHSKQGPVVIPKQSKSTETGQVSTGTALSGHFKQGSDLPPKLPPKQSKSTETGQASTEAVLHSLCDSTIVISQFSYPDIITSICPTPDGCAWLCNDKTNTVNRINNKGQVLQKIKHNIDIDDISLDPTTGRLWFCCLGERTIYEVSTSSTPVRRFTTEGLPASLCVTREGRVVVGTVGRHEYKVVMYTVDGQVLHSATVEGSGTGLVRSITQCGVTGNIAIVSSKLINGDRNDPYNYRRHIKVYNPTLQSLFHYRGEGIQAREAVGQDTFGPVIVVYDSKGNIVIADWTRNTIELISGSGKYKQTLYDGRQGPVGIQQGGVLWSCSELDTGEKGLKLLKYYSD